MEAKHSALKIEKFEGDLTKIHHAATRNMDIAFHVKEVTNSKEDPGIRIEWHFWLYGPDKTLLLEYLAFDDFDVENPEFMDDRQAKRLLNESFTRLRLEYEHRTASYETLPLGYNISADNQIKIINELVNIFYVWI